MRTLLLLWVSCFAVAPAALGAQRATPLLSATPGRDSLPRTEEPPAGLRSPRRLVAPRIPRRDSSWWVPLASALVPGAGQKLLGQDRFVAYLAVEGFALISFVNQDAEATRERNRSRALAHEVARALFPGDRPVGSWEYYELMEKAAWIESGVYNRFPGGEFSPEADRTTYNGWLWFDIRQRFWRDPNVEPDHASAEYRNALNEYLARGIRPEYRWSWRNAQLEQDVFRASIRHKNAAARAARTQLAVLAANHLLATIDAFVTLRLRGGAGAGGGSTALVATVPWPSLGRTGTR